MYSPFTSERNHIDDIHLRQAPAPPVMSPYSQSKSAGNIHKGNDGYSGSNSGQSVSWNASYSPSRPIYSRDDSNRRPIHQTVTPPTDNNTSVRFNQSDYPMDPHNHHYNTTSPVAQLRTSMYKSKTLRHSAVSSSPGRHGTKSPEIPLEEVDFVAKYGMNNGLPSPTYNAPVTSVQPHLASRLSPPGYAYIGAYGQESPSTYQSISNAQPTSLRLQNQHLTSQLYTLQKELQSLKNNVVPGIEEHADNLRQECDDWKNRHNEALTEIKIKNIELDEMKTDHKRLQVENKEMKERTEELQRVNQNQLEALNNSKRVMQDQLQQLRQDLEKNSQMQLKEVEGTYQREALQRSSIEKHQEHRIHSMISSLQKLHKFHKHQQHQSNDNFEKIANYELFMALQGLKDTTTQSELSLQLMQQAYDSLMRDAQSEQIVFGRHMQQLREQIYSEISHRESQIFLLNGELEGEQQEVQRLRNQVSSLQKQLRHSRELLEIKQKVRDTELGQSNESSRLMHRMESLQQQNKHLLELQEELQEQTSRERQTRRELEQRIMELKNGMHDMDDLKQKNLQLQEQIDSLETLLSETIQEHDKAVKEKEEQLENYESQKRRAMLQEAESEEKQRHVEELEEELERYTQETNEKLHEIENTRHMVQQLRQQIIHVEQSRKQDKFEISQRDKEIQRLNREISAGRENLERVQAVLKQRMEELTDARRKLAELDSRHSRRFINVHSIPEDANEA